MNVLIKKSTLILFALIVVVAIGGSVLSGLRMRGTQRIGFPFPFCISTSAPPPMFGSTFYWKWLAIDLLIYYALAVCISFVWGLLRAR